MAALDKRYSRRRVAITKQTKLKNISKVQESSFTHNAWYANDRSTDLPLNPFKGEFATIKNMVLNYISFFIEQNYDGMWYPDNLPCFLKINLRLILPSEPTLQLSVESL